MSGNNRPLSDLDFLLASANQAECSALSCESTAEALENQARALRLQADLDRDFASKIRTHSAGTKGPSEPNADEALRSVADEVLAQMNLATARELISAFKDLGARLDDADVRAKRRAVLSEIGDELDHLTASFSEKIEVDAPTSGADLNLAWIAEAPQSGGYARYGLYHKVGSDVRALAIFVDIPVDRALPWRVVMAGQ